MRLRMTRRMRTYTDVTDADIAAQIAGEHGLQTEVDVDGPRYDVVQQLNQSDLAFLRERARLVQAELWCTGRTLHFRSRPAPAAARADAGAGQRAALRPAVRRPGPPAQRGGGHRLRRRPRGRHRRAGRGRRDRGRGRRRPDRPAGGRSRRWAASATLRVREAALTASRGAGLGEGRDAAPGRGVRHRGRHDPGHAGPGRGQQAPMQSVGAPFEGDGYYVTRVRHTFDQVHGLRTCFEAERATVNEVA